MAKKAKKELTLEEKLQNALVADWEQPYAVPENWVWTRLGKVFRFIDYRGKTPSKINKGVPLITAKNVKKGFIDYSISEFISHEEFLNRQSRGISKKNDILFTTEAPLGNVALADLETYSTGQRLITFQKKYDSEPVLNEFYFFYMLCDLFQADIQKNKTGTTVAGIKAEKLKLVCTPLPPLAEQERIVQRIESLFAKLDTAKELLEEVLESFESRKSALLHQAFTGELTKTWREKHGVGMDSWKKTQIQHIGSVKGGKRLPKGDSLVKENTGFPYIKAGNLKNGTVLNKDIEYLTPKTHENIKRYTVATNDVYITIVGACIGDVGVIPAEFDGANLTENAAKITDIQGFSQFIALYLSSEMSQSQIKSKIASATLGKLSLQNIKSIEIHLPTLPEQEEIVRILDAQLQKEGEAKAHIQHSLEHIEHMKKAILARAFRGELGTSNPEDESAVELLKEILAQE